MKRDFRCLSVTESSTDCLAICILLVDGVYMKITKEIKDKTEFRREKLHVFQREYAIARVRGVIKIIQNGVCRRAILFYGFHENQQLDHKMKIKLPLPLTNFKLEQFTNHLESPGGLQTFLVFPQHPAWFIIPVNRQKVRL